LLQARQVDQTENQGLGQDILKILYASEDEKVTIGNEGKLTITAPDGTISSQSEAPKKEEKVEKEEIEAIAAIDQDAEEIPAADELLEETN